jgi:hypothetical protein
VSGGAGEAAKKSTAPPLEILACICTIGDVNSVAQFAHSEESNGSTLGRPKSLPTSSPKGLPGLHWAMSPSDCRGKARDVLAHAQATGRATARATAKRPASVWRPAARQHSKSDFSSSAKDAATPRNDPHDFRKGAMRVGLAFPGIRGSPNAAGCGHQPVHCGFGNPPEGGRILLGTQPIVVQR